MSDSYYVAPDGSDITGDGSAADPFATLNRAQSAMENNSVSTTYVEDGTYDLTRPLNLTSADSGMSFIAAPGQHPILNAASAGLNNLVSLTGTQNVTLQGLTFANSAIGNYGAVTLTNATSNSIVGDLFSNNGTGVLITGSNNNIVSGNEIDNSGNTAITVGNASNNNTIDSNLINGTQYAPDGLDSGIFVTGGNNNAFTHNSIVNTAGSGISILNWDANDPSNINTRDTIAYNSIVNPLTVPNDGGAIVLSNASGTDMQMSIYNNYTSIPAQPTEGVLDVGIYLDESSSGVTVTNNIVDGGNFGFHMHGGANNSIYNNIFNIETMTAPNIGAGLLQPIPGGPVAMTGDRVFQNIIYSTATGPSTAWVSYFGGSATVADNLYFNVNGQPIDTAGIDINPQVGDPRFVDLSSGNYALGAGSAASAIGFQGIDQAAIGLAPTTAQWF